MPLASNISLDRYKIRSQIGAGGMGDVYVADDSLLERKVALKVLRPELAVDPECLARFKREVRAASALNHPNIVTVFDVGQQNGSHYVVTELIEGATLRDWVDSERPSLADLADAIRQAAIALDEAHRAGIIHRDVKPENLMRRDDGLVKVLDFGISKMMKAAEGTGVPDRPSITAAGTVIGTVRYMSPEQALGEELDGRTDVWSLGVVLYELASGRPPFEKESTTATLLDIVSSEPVPLSDLLTDAPKPLCNVVERALRKDRESRFQTAADMAYALESSLPILGSGGVNTASVTLLSETAAVAAITPSRQSRKSDSHGKRTVIKIVSAETHNLPTPPTNLRPQRFKLIGRKRELSEIVSAIRRSEERLLTLTGPGGTGKTRLAIETGRKLLNPADFPDGVFFVDLSLISDPELIARPIARALGVLEGPGVSLGEAVQRQIMAKRLLLVLDNFEHVLDGSIFVSELLTAAPGLKILATSRAPLRLSQETEYTVKPLELPGPTTLPRPEQLVRIPAVALFVERAQQAKRSFTLSEKNAAAVAEICRRLEGLPLALELAAARIKLLTPDAMLDRLDDRLKLLTGGARDLPGRQQTMRGAIEWSYDLLTDEERTVLQRLAVFVSGCTLEAADIVCGTGDESVLDMIGSLIEKSLISQREQEDGKGRFTMLEMVREYALEQLEAIGEAKAVRLRFARYFKQLAANADKEIRRGHQIAWVRRLNREHENIKAALAILLDEEPGEGAAFVGSVQSFWSAQAFSYSERRAWLDKALEARDLSPGLRARLLNGLTRCEVHVGRSEEAVTFGRQAVSVARTTGDRDVIGIALAGLGNALSVAGDLSAAREAFEEYAELARETGSQHSLSVALGSIGEVARMTGDLRAASKYYKQALDAAGDNRSVPCGIILANLGGVSLEQGNDAAAQGYYRKSLEIVSGFENKLWTGIAIDGLAALALKEGDTGKAAMLAGAAEALNEASGSPLDKWEQSLRERYVAKLRSSLDTEMLERQWMRGRMMTLNEATRVALAN